MGEHFTFTCNENKTKQITKQILTTTIFCFYISKNIPTAVSTYKILQLNGF